MMYIRFPLSLRQVEDRFHERDIDINYQCNAIQGFIFSPPVPADEIPRLLKQDFPGVDTEGGTA